MRASLYRREYCVARKRPESRAGVLDSFRGATSSDKLWLLRGRLSQEVDAPAKGLAMFGWHAGRSGENGQNIYIPSWKNANGEGRLRSAATRFRGVEVERPVKNVIKMCLWSCQGGKTLWILSGTPVALRCRYRYMRRFAIRKQPRIYLRAAAAARDWFLARKQADSFKRVERFHSRWWLLLFLSLSLFPEAF